MAKKITHFDKKTDKNLWAVFMASSYDFNNDTASSWSTQLLM